jgi:hypothetical protein
MLQGAAEEDGQVLGRLRVQHLQVFHLLQRVDPGMRTNVSRFIRSMLSVVVD